ncbi:MAG: hypothetical protein HY064_02090 [Bacteroidetes bacterium]|nr:hypothetical protein [Bacteroidota bacterium]
MMTGHGFWYSVGRAFYKFFDLLQWMYDHISPNKILILGAFMCFIWWMTWQHKLNKKAIQEGKLK